MAVKTLSNIFRYIGDTADSKPTQTAPGSTYFDRQTGILYITYDGTNWVVKDARQYDDTDKLAVSLYGKGTAAGDTVIGVEQTDRLKVTVTNPDGTNVGGTGGTASTDRADFTAGTSSGTPIEAVAETSMLRSAETANDLVIVKADLFRQPYHRTAFQDVVKKSIDDILDVIGVENVKLFLPMWEQSGTTMRDLLRRSTTFTVSGATLAQTGPMGFCPSFDGVNDYVQQDPITENTAGTADYNLTTTTGKAGTRTIALATNPAFIRLRLKRTGTLNTATVRIQLMTNVGDVPTANVTNGQSAALACSSIGTSYEERGFTFATPPGLSKASKYWITLEYADSTGVDASNYISWAYETGANTYGERRATFDGASWTGTPSENHRFSLYEDNLQLGNNDCSLIVLSDWTGSSVAGQDYVRSQGMTATSLVLRQDGGNGYTAATTTEAPSTDLSSIAYRYVGGAVSHIITFSYTNATAKHKLYRNGALVTSTNGTATTALVAQAQPFVIGSAINSAGALSGYFPGRLGPIILTKSELSAANIGKISHYLLPLRKLMEAI